MSERREPIHLVCRPSCTACGKPASHVELVPPGGLPSARDTWPPEHQAVYSEYHDATMWRFVFEGIAGGNGLGDDCSADEAAPYLAAFSQPLTFEKVHGAKLYDDAGFCEECDKPYCYEHWNVSAGGYGHCPEGHGKSLDPHWSPDDYD